MIIIIIIWVFPTSANWWSFTGVWATASLLKFPGLFLVFWLILVMLQSGWSHQLILWFLNLTVPLSSLWRLFQVLQLQLVSLSTSFSITFPVFWPIFSLFSIFLIFTLLSTGMAKSTIWQVPFFLLTITKSNLWARIKWSVSISKFQRILCISFSRMDYELCTYHLFMWSNFNFLHNSQWIIFSPPSCSILFCTNFLHSLIWLNILSLSPHTLANLLFLIYFHLVHMALICAASRRNAVSFLRFHFLSHV